MQGLLGKTDYLDHSGLGADCTTDTSLVTLVNDLLQDMNRKSAPLNIVSCLSVSFCMPRQGRIERYHAVVILIVPGRQGPGDWCWTLLPLACGVQKAPSCLVCCKLCNHFT